MRLKSSAASIAALSAMLIWTGLGSGAGAQTADPGVPAASESGLAIEWEVRSRFRLFRREADFQQHVVANRAGSQLAAEHLLQRDTGGRGWAQSLVDHLCVNAAGAILDTCERDGERENYLAPKTHLVVARLAGAVPPGATCNWSFDDGSIPPKQVNAPCTEPVEQRLAYGKPTIAAVGITRPDNSVDSVSAEIAVRDLLIAGLGDSVAAGEGNPDRPVALSDEGFCFRRFLGAARGEYFRPSRQGYKGDKACDDQPGGSAATTSDWNSHGARWMSAACHRSLYGYQLRTALALAAENPRLAVTFLPLACTGATIERGLFGSQGASDCPLRGSCAGSVPPQIEQLNDLLDRARKIMPARQLDLVLLTVGANDIKFAGLVADVIISTGIERTLFSQGGQLATVPQAQAILDRELPNNFAKLRNALKPLVGGDLSRVVYVSYGHPALQGDAACPGGRDGLDIHPAFTADGDRLRNVTDFVLNRFLPRVKSLARCEAGSRCASPATDRMTFVDSHQAAFAEHGICARSPEDPQFDRECFSADGNSFEADPVQAATGPLVCSLRPSEFRPYAPRARWIRTANDSYFTAMTYPRGLPSTMQPSNIHDASWGAMSAVYGGAFHPSAEGHAAMADAALPAVRAALGLNAPPEVVAQPLPPPAGQIAPPQ
jgi:lysophospholipase L1-like esterase